MWIKVNQKVITPHETLEAGDVGEVYDSLGVYLKLRGRAIQVEVPDDVEQRFQMRLNQGAGLPCVFYPFLGEFGHQIMYHMRLVHFHKASRKTVCCRRGFEVLYPSADAFDYDWTNPISDENTAGTERMFRDWPEISQRYPGQRMIQGGNTLLTQELFVLGEGPIPLKPRLRGLKVDVCIGTRARRMDVSKNWQHWGQVARALQAMGMTIAVIGTRETSYPIDGAVMSGDYGDVDAAVELLQNCTLFLGGDSGCAHLAAAVGAKMLVMPVPVSKRYLSRMELANPGRVDFFPDDFWNDPQKAIDVASAALAVTA